MRQPKTATKKAGIQNKRSQKTAAQSAAEGQGRRLSQKMAHRDTEASAATPIEKEGVEMLSAPVFSKFKMDVSENGLHLIKQFEGFVPVLYNDPVGHCTIGYGTLVHKGPCNGSEPEEFKTGITEQRATELLIKKVEQFAAAINHLVQVPLNQNQFDALVSFVYNVGAGALQRSTLLKELNKGNYEKVPAELRKWVKASGRILPGLVKRRAAEAALYQKEITVILL